MRVGNLKGRAVLFTEVGVVDVERASDGRFPSGIHALYGEWDAFAAWAADLSIDVDATAFRAEDLEAPSPTPRQVFAVGLNYREHAVESGFAIPGSPTVFTKFPSCITGPVTRVELPVDGSTDWEVELVAVISRPAFRVSVADAWDHVAGLTIGQDLSERIMQTAGPAPQFSLGKSFSGFGPTGPWLVTPDEFPDRDDIALGCRVNGVEMQNGSTRDLVFPVAELVSRLSHTVTLFPGDLIFTGTPAGVGMGRDPQVYLQPGDVLESFIEGIGELRQELVATGEGVDRMP